MLCVKDCVAGVWREVNGLPEIITPEGCINCGHCVAVCPSKAIEHSEMDPMQIRSTDKSSHAPDVYREIVRCRRSIRSYRDKQVPKDKVEDILKLASHSPTAGNQQDVAYTVITDKDLLEDISTTVFGLGKRTYLRTKAGLGKFIYRFLQKLSMTTALDRYLETMAYYIDQSEKGRDLILHHAPTLILVHAPRKGQFHNENCNIAAANIMNYAHSHGLGTCYIGFLITALKFNKNLQKRLSIPRAHKIYACLIMGYPQYSHRFTASRKLPAIKWIQQSQS
jgi:nitroreductase